MHNPAQDKLADFISDRLGKREVVEPEGVKRDRERQEALKARAANIGQWRQFVARERAPVPENLVDGSVVKKLRETCDLSTTDLGEVLGVSPNDVQAFERGQKTFADKKFHAFAAAARDAIIENAERQGDSTA